MLRKLVASALILAVLRHRRRRCLCVATAMATTTAQLNARQATKFRNLSVADGARLRAARSTRTASPASTCPAWVPWACTTSRATSSVTARSIPSRPRRWSTSLEEHGRLKLAAVEYVVFKAAWDAQPPRRRRRCSARPFNLTPDGQPLRTSGVLLPARVDVQAQPRRHVLDVEPDGDVHSERRSRRSRGRLTRRANAGADWVPMPQSAPGVVCRFASVREESGVSRDGTTVAATKSVVGPQSTPHRRRRG